MDESKERFFQTFEDLIKQNGVTIDRPAGSVHPRFPDLVYPIDYGYVNGTKSQDGQGMTYLLAAILN